MREQGNDESLAIPAAGDVLTGYSARLALDELIIAIVKGDDICLLKTRG
jgi:hypothetical protein